MNQNAIFGPFLSVMLLTLLVWFYMYSKRIPFIQKSKINPNDLTPAELARMSPPAVANPSDNLKNLFELPALFYGLALYLFVTNHVDETYVIAAWIFVGFRVLHSAVHWSCAATAPHRSATVLEVFALTEGTPRRSSPRSSRLSRNSALRRY